MTDFPEVIYLHDGQDDIAWSEHEEVGGVRYEKSEDRKNKRALIASEPMLENNAKYYAWKCKTECVRSENGFHFLPPKGLLIAGYCFDFGVGVDYGHFFISHRQAVLKSESLLSEDQINDGGFEIVPLFCAQVGI